MKMPPKKKINIISYFEKIKYIKNPCKNCKVSFFPSFDKLPSEEKKKKRKEIFLKCQKRRASAGGFLFLFLFLFPAGKCRAEVK